MTKYKPNTYKYVLIEFDSEPTKNNKAWVDNHFGMSVHINDRVVAINHNDAMWSGRVIRRSNLVPREISPLRVRYTANQFPVADHPVQPELPVVPNLVRITQSIMELEILIKNLKELV